MTQVQENLKKLFNTLEIGSVVTEKEITKIKKMFVTGKAVKDVRKARNQVVMFTSEQTALAREQNDMPLFDKWNNTMSKVTSVLDLTLNHPDNEAKIIDCKIVNTKGDKVFYLGTMKVNGTEIKVKFNRKGEERYSVTYYEVNGTKLGSNLVGFLTDEGLMVNRTKILDSFVTVAEVLQG